jgi:hypothetical protein
MPSHESHEQKVRKEQEEPLRGLGFENQGHKSAELILEKQT